MIVSHDCEQNELSWKSVLVSDSHLIGGIFSQFLRDGEGDGSIIPVEGRHGGVSASSLLLFYHNPLIMFSPFFHNLIFFYFWGYCVM